MAQVAHELGDPRRTTPAEIIPERVDNSAEIEAARLRREQAAKAKQFASWDKLLAHPAFEEYLLDRGLSLDSTSPELPADLEAEQAALGAMLIDQDAVDVGLRTLRPALLCYRPHLPILKAIATIAQRRRAGQNVQVDLITVHTQLRRAGDLDEYMSAYISALVERCPSSANIEAYIDPVLETARLRALYWLGRALQSAAVAHEANPLQLINAAAGALQTIEQRGTVDAKVALTATK